MIARDITDSNRKTGAAARAKSPRATRGKGGRVRKRGGGRENNKDTTPEGKTKIQIAKKKKKRLHASNCCCNVTCNRFTYSSSQLG